MMFPVSSAACRIQKADPRAGRRLEPSALKARGKRSQQAFTMVEIALALAVIAFALVAIIGVLPTGITVQKQNLEDTIINQDGVYFMEAIRSGAEGIYELSNYVNEVSIIGTPIMNLSNLNGRQIIGLLTTPGTTNVATVRAISGSAAEK